MTEPRTISQHDDPVLADTMAEPPQGAPSGLEHARVKSWVRDALFGRGEDPVRIGRFTILRRLGTGGMGVVYSAFDDELERKVAIKLLRPDGDSGAQARARLRREAQAVARLSHPNVVPVFEVGEHRGEVFVAMEFVRGSTLRQWLEQPRSWRAIRDVMVQAGRGLQAAHEAGIVHRDFKSDNVMVGVDGVGREATVGRARVLDFGVAAVGEPDGSSLPGRETPHPGGTGGGLTLEGSLLGTPMYMAPEGLRGEKAGPAADQFSFCVTLWEALFGQRPFRGETLKALLEAVEARPGPVPPSTPPIPPRLKAALVRGLAPRADDRFEDMAALLTELEHDPATTRRRVLLGLGTVTVIGSLTAAVWTASGSDACNDGRASLQEVWSAERRSTAQEALVDADPEVALRTWDAAVGAVDDYASRWTTAQEQSCDAGVSTDEAHLQSQLCLQWALQDLRPIADALAGGDPTAVRRAPDDVEALLDPTDCLDAQARNRLANERARRSAPAPAGSEQGLVSDFESEPVARFGAGWAASTDAIIGGHSTVAFEVVEGGARQSDHALRIHGTVQNDSPAKWSGAMLFTGDEPFAPANLQGKQTFSFWAKGQPGTYDVMLFTTDQGFSPAMQEFEVDSTWRRCEFDLDSLEPDRFDVTGMFIGSSRDGDFDLRIDDVAFE